MPQVEFSSEIYLQIYESFFIEDKCTDIEIISLLKKGTEWQWKNYYYKNHKIKRLAFITDMINRYHMLHTTIFKVIPVCSYVLKNFRELFGGDDLRCFPSLTSTVKTVSFKNTLTGHIAFSPYSCCNNCNVSVSDFTER